MPFDTLPNEYKELIRNNPNNPITRSVLRNKGLLIPRDITVLESIIDYINENNLSINVKPRVNITSNTNTNTATRTREETLSVDVEYSETEYGTCRYFVNRSGVESVNVPISIIREAIVENDNDIICDYVRQHIDYNFEDYDNYRYEDHEYSDSDNSDDNIGDRMAQNLIEDYIEQYGHPDDENDDDEDSDDE